MSKVVYDLTELFVASTGKYAHYGIMRVVESIGCELYRLDPDLRFAFFSYAHDTFFEVHPSFDHKTENVCLNLPKGVKQIHHFRRRFYSRHKLRDFVAPLAHKIIRLINLRYWENIETPLHHIDINGKTLVSMGRPKHMVAALDALDKQGVNYTFIPLLHDMFPLHDFSLENPKQFPLNFIGDNRHVIQHASKIIANSEFTKSEILNFARDGLLPPLPEIITVPLVQQCRDGTEAPLIEIPQTPYLLTVGSTVGRKNLEVVFEAMRMLEESGGFVPRLVLAGAPRKRSQKYLSQARYDNIRPYVQTVVNPHQTDLVRLYRNAVAVVVPSRLEGWGLPAGEALWNGTPVICSTASVFFEVCGGLGLYFDPNRPDELAKIITCLYEDERFANELRSRIAANGVRLRTWANVAEDVKRVYELS
jgi:glycosyltransferase involved in cell wall biosynthesis